MTQGIVDQLRKAGQVPGARGKGSRDPEDFSVVFARRSGAGACWVTDRCGMRSGKHHPRPRRGGWRTLDKEQPVQPGADHPIPDEFCTTRRDAFAVLLGEHSASGHRVSAFRS